MKKIAFILFAAVLSVGTAFAEEVKQVGTIVNFSLTEKKATAELKDSKTGIIFNVIIEDEMTLDKLKDHRINNGDEIRVKYDNSTGVAKLFKKTAGC